MLVERKYPVLEHSFAANSKNRGAATTRKEIPWYAKNLWRTALTAID
jgi:hypothetical protein